MEDKIIKLFEEIKSQIESATNDEDVKIGLCKILDTPRIDVKDARVKTFMRKYTKEILEIKKVNREYLDGKLTELPYSS